MIIETYETFKITYCMKKHFLSLFLLLPLISSCTSITEERIGLIDTNKEGILTEQRKLVKNLSVQQRISGGFALCSEVGVWKCLPLTKKTDVNPFVEVSAADSASIDQLNSPITEASITPSSEWLIQVGAYKSDTAIKHGLAILSAKNVGFITQKNGNLTLLSVIGFTTKEDALRELNNYVNDFNKPFVKKMTH